MTGGDGELSDEEDCEDDREERSFAAAGLVWAICGGLVGVGRREVIAFDSFRGEARLGAEGKGLAGVTEDAATL